uniref:Uncharacterized protein n=1 Tax=Leptobrachium leishanense TaxID=445787 RepID=A0A8C5Q3A0_9ANUR
MEEDRNQVTKKILDITLEIISLLAGEDHMVVRRKSAECSVSCMCRDMSEGSCRIRSCSSVSAPRFPLRERHNEQKILELSNQIIRLLTGEVPIRCEDVTVYLSMEEWEYVERHKELYEDLMMEDHRPLRAAGELERDRRDTPSASPQNREETVNKAPDRETSSIPSELNATRANSAVCVSQTSPALTEENLTDLDLSSPTEHQTERKPTMEEPTLWEQGDPTRGNTERRPSGGPSACIKEEPASDEEGDFMETRPQTEPIATCIKEEPSSWSGRNVLDPPTQHLHTDYISVRIKEEPVPCDERDLMDIYPHTVIKEECASFGEENHPGIYSHSECPCAPMKEDPDLCEGSVLHGDTQSLPYRNVAGKPPHSTRNAEPMFNCSGCETCCAGNFELVKRHVKNTTVRSETGMDNFSESDYATEETYDGEEEPFSCYQFGESFTEKASLLTHQTIHQGEKPYVCTECGKCFTQSSSLSAHKRIHTGEKPYKCNDCGKCFTRTPSLAAHRRTHTGEKPYKCDECGKCFTEASNLTTHKKTHTGEKTYKCDECGKYFTRASILAAHKRTHTRERPYKCSDCGKGFTVKHNLLLHLRSHTTDKGATRAAGLAVHENLHADVNMNSYPGNSQAEHPSTSREGGHLGDLCPPAHIKMEEAVSDGSLSDDQQNSVYSETINSKASPKSPQETEPMLKGFPGNSELDQHQEAHTLVTPQIGKAIGSESDFMVEKTNQRKEPLFCSECGKPFKSKSSLIAHMKTHKGVKPYKCTECGKCFTLPSSLKVHRRIHTGEKPYKCIECGRCFTQASSLAAHRRTHTGEKPYKCNECGKCFTESSTLSVHRKRHTYGKIYKCNDCGKCFIQASSLKVHRKTHSADDSYKCNECGKCFTQATNLDAHQMTYSEKKHTDPNVETVLP